MCQGETVGTLGFIQPFPIPTCTWIDISMDFIKGLPKSYGKSIIMVVVDRISKYAYFCILAYPFKDFTRAQLFLDNIFKFHGMPTSIINDCDPTFISNF